MTMDFASGTVERICKLALQHALQLEEIKLERPACGTYIWGHVTCISQPWGGGGGEWLRDQPRPCRRGVRGGGCGGGRGCGRCVCRGACIPYAIDFEADMGRASLERILPRWRSSTREDVHCG